MTGVVVVAATARYSDPFDWVGPNLSSNTLLVYPAANYAGTSVSGFCTPQSCFKGPPPGPKMSVAQFDKIAHQVATAIGATGVVPLYEASASLNRTTAGRNFTGNVYVATPSLLALYHIAPGSIDPHALVLTSRPGLPGVSSQLALSYGDAVTNPNFDNGVAGPCPPGYCTSPQIQEVGALPTGTSAPNTVLTMHAVHSLHLSMSVQAYLLTTRGSLTTLQKQTARVTAASTGSTIETANSFASLNEVLAWSIGAGLLLALGVLAMTVGLIRSETASELRVLTATGASRRTRRNLTGVTAATLGFVGAVLGVATAFALVAAFLSQNNGANLSELTENLPIRPVGIMVLGLPLLAGIGGWLFAGREPRGIGRQPIE